MVGERRPKHRGIRKAGIIPMLVFLAWTSLPGGEDKEIPATALDNPILRSPFLDQFLTLRHSAEPSRTPSRFAQTFVDRQIEHFLVRVEGKLERLQNSLNDLIQIRQQLLEGGSDRDSRPRSQWKDRTREISRSSEELRRMLAVIFLQLRARDDFKPAVNGTADNILFEVEIKYLTRQTEAATRLIRSYLFNADATVHITDLRRTNMLILLHHIRQMARVLEQTIQ